MYRCHYTFNSRIVAGDDLDVDTLRDAIREAETRLAERALTEAVEGFELWKGDRLLHISIQRA